MKIHIFLQINLLLQYSLSMLSCINLSKTYKIS
nr:MAG TPA: hypothetical protein [Crassvirales sp.]